MAVMGEDCLHSSGKSGSHSSGGWRGRGLPMYWLEGGWVGRAHVTEMWGDHKRGGSNRGSRGGVGGREPVLPL